MSAGEARPRSWPELRDRVLAEGYLDDGELEYRRRWAHRLKYAVSPLR